MSEELMPDKNGRFGIYGGRYVAETLVPALEELSEQYEIIKKDENFLKEFKDDLAHYVGRPSPLYYAKRWTEILGRVKRLEMVLIGASGTTIILLISLIVRA